MRRAADTSPAEPWRVKNACSTTEPLAMSRASASITSSRVHRAGAVGDAGGELLELGAVAGGAAAVVTDAVASGRTPAAPLPRSPSLHTRRRARAHASRPRARCPPLVVGVALTLLTRT